MPETLTELLTYSNPRDEVIIEDWPSGRFKTKAIFKVECKCNKGQRATRTTINPKTNKPNATKVMTYSDRVLFVDGDDGKLYIIELCQTHITVMRGTFDYQQETLFPNNPRYAAVRALFK